MKERMAVYFAKRGKRIKIGVAKNVQSRLRQLKTASAAPIKLIASLSGGFPLERSIHRRLEAQRISGEWFRDCHETRLVIQEFTDLHVPDYAGFIPLSGHSPPAIARKFGSVAKVLWPVKTAACLASIAKTDERTAKRWLRGEHEPPLSVVLAVVHEMLREQTQLDLR